MKIKESLKKGDPIEIALSCAEYKGDKYKNECIEGRLRAEEEIQKIISRKKDMPFFKLIIDPETQKSISLLLQKDIYLGIKYRSIWKETSESN
ncbi:MAG: hypothetical protein H7A24_02180 [Leptospiraceae bacterium]|nr:hypothetical protein [Leptospiraceae bacterium]MCP5510657.1 hypothetical protein [Leptospiraceae bacterium]